MFLSGAKFMNEQCFTLRRTNYSNSMQIVFIFNKINDYYEICYIVVSSITNNIVKI